MLKTITFIAFIAFAAASMNTIDATPTDSTGPEFSHKLSANAASHSQLAALEAEGF